MIFSKNRSKKITFVKYRMFWIFTIAIVFLHSCVWFSHVPYWATLLQYKHKPKLQAHSCDCLKKLKILNTHACLIYTHACLIYTHACLIYTHACLIYTHACRINTLRGIVTVPYCVSTQHAYVSIQHACMFKIYSFNMIDIFSSYLILRSSLVHKTVDM
jgi:hypothetical protein